MVDLNDVALFVQVVRAGSFAEASRRLGVPPNTTSRRIQALEDSVGTRLLQRSTRRLSLTTAGHAFFARCAEQVESLGRSAQELQDGHQQVRGKLRVAAPANFLDWLPIDAVREFLDRHPGVHLEFDLSDRVVDMLREGIDVAFRAGQVLDPQLVARRIGNSRLELVASPEYLAARGTPMSLQDLATHDGIHRSTPPDGRALWQLQGPKGPCVVETACRFSASSGEAQLRAALCGLGIALLPRMLSDQHLQAGRLQQVLPSVGVEGVGVYVVYLNRKHLPRAVGALIEFFTARLQGLEPEPAAAGRSSKAAKPWRSA